MAYHTMLQPELKGCWKFFGRFDLGGTWFFHAPVPPGTTKDNFDFATYMHEETGTPFDVECAYIDLWDQHFMLADSYRRGRVCIAGDAAHIFPHDRGYGVNSGLEDVRNPAFNMAGMLQGWGGAALLDFYDAERRPVFRSTIKDFTVKSIEDDRVFLDMCDPSRDRGGFRAGLSGASPGGDRRGSCFCA